MAGFGFTITLVDLLMRTSRFQDVLLPGLHVPLMVMILGAVALLLSGRLFQSLFTRIGRSMALLTFLMLLSVGVSIWPGGAYQYVLDNWIPVLPTFLLLCGFVRTFRQLKKTLLVTACGYAAVSYFGILYRTDMGVGRGGISSFTFGNSNDLAMIILLGLPLVFWAALDKRTNVFVRLYLLGSFLCSIPVFFNTGSRGGLLALIGVGLYALVRLRTATRLRLIAVTAVVLPVGLAMVPDKVIDRYTTMFATLGAPRDPIANPESENGKEPDELVVDSATASANSRLELLKRSITVTFENPLLGVGPGMFVVAENEMAVAAGRRRGYWKASHNMYTQVSSEVGLPGAIIFVYLIVLVWRSLTRAEKAHPSSFSFAPEMRRIGLTLKISMLVFILCGMTLSMAYGAILPMLCGWSIAIDRLLAAGAWKARTEAEEEESPTAAESVPAFARVPLPASPRT